MLGEIFTPIGLKPTVLFPGTNGGANWGGASWDQATHTLFVNSMIVVAEALEDAQSPEAIEEIRRTAVKQLRMIVIGINSWRSNP